LAQALLEMIVQQPTWRELRKVAGPTFDLATSLTETDALVLSELLVSNRENLERWVDALSDALASLRDALAEDEVETLAKRFAEAQALRREWLRTRTEGHWDEPSQQELPERPSMLDSFIGSSLRKKLRGER